MLCTAADTDDTDECGLGCVYTPAYTPLCDLDPSTDSSSTCLAGCVYTATYTPVCDFDLATDDTALCPVGCRNTMQYRRDNCTQISDATGLPIMRWCSGGCVPLTSCKAPTPANWTWEGTAVSSHDYGGWILDEAEFAVAGNDTVRQNCTEPTKFEYTTSFCVPGSGDYFRGGLDTGFTQCTEPWDLGPENGTGLPVRFGSTNSESRGLCHSRVICLLYGSLSNVAVCVIEQCMSTSTASPVATSRMASIPSCEPAPTQRWLTNG